MTLLPPGGGGGVLRWHLNVNVLAEPSSLKYLMVVLPSIDPTAYPEQSLKRATDRYCCSSDPEDESMSRGWPVASPEPGPTSNALTALSVVATTSVSPRTSIARTLACRSRVHAGAPPMGVRGSLKRTVPSHDPLTTRPPWCSSHLTALTGFPCLATTNPALSVPLASCHSLTSLLKPPKSRALSEFRKQVESTGLESFTTPAAFTGSPNPPRPFEATDHKRTVESHEEAARRLLVPVSLRAIFEIPSVGSSEGGTLTSPANPRADKGSVPPNMVLR
mmetsp:Transcript_15618/g.32078  ORF Transcript_15618/g.32078 Transcript_15618/m.32078 type:complete len:277 (-) Transcript_15618:29-859(-)